MSKVNCNIYRSLAVLFLLIFSGCAATPSFIVKTDPAGAAIFVDGQQIGFQDKRLLPTYDVFDERRYFEPGSKQFIYTYRDLKIGITICEDAWQHAHEVRYSDYTVDPIFDLAQEKVDVLLNLSSSPYSFARVKTRQKVFQAAAQALQAPVIVCNQVGANDQLVFDGYSMCFDKAGFLCKMANGFMEEDLLVDISHLKHCIVDQMDHVKDLYCALVLGVRDYFHKQGFEKAVLGLSGGVDSALVACIAVEALGAVNVHALALPSRYSAQQSYDNARHLAQNLQLDLKEISIDCLFQQYLDVLQGQFASPLRDITEQNLQARIRGMILMAHTNQEGSLLLNTSNKSESAMGFTTIYGDLCGGLGVLLDVSKNQVYALCRYINKEQEVIPNEILARAPTAELRFNQTDLDVLAPYEVLDAIVEKYVEDGLSIQEIANQLQKDEAYIEQIVGQIHKAEYKRRQAPLAIRVTKKSFSKGRNVPIVQLWK